MKANDQNRHFPVLSIGAFREGQLAGQEDLAYHELHGVQYIEKAHKHDFLVMILFERAKGTHEIDFVEHPVARRQMHLLFPGQVHRWDMQAGTHAYQLMIGRTLFEHFSSCFRYALIHYRENPVIPLSEEAFGLLLYEFKAIRAELEHIDPLPELIRSRAAVVASLLSREAAKVFKDTVVCQSQPRLQRFLQLIDMHFKTHKLVSFYAEQLHISANYLNILCKKHLGIAATQLIQQRTLLEAKRLLQASVFSVKEIAFELGFVDHAYFSNFFKQQTGMRPTDFREQ